MFSIEKAFTSQISRKYTCQKFIQKSFKTTYQKKKILSKFIAVSILAELMTLNCLWQLEFILTVCYWIVQFSNLNFLFGKYSSWANTGYCIFSNLYFFVGKYSSWEKIGSCKEVQFLGENGDSAGLPSVPERRLWWRPQQQT